MSYKLQEQALVPGSVNLLPPKDLVAAGDCLDLLNWRPDVAGKLQQITGYTMRNEVDTGHQLDMICVVGFRRYFGGSGSLYQIGRSAGAAIDTGFGTAYAIGSIGFQDFGWFMSQSKQRKDDGTNVRNWTPQSPAAIAAAVGAGGSLPVGDYDYYTTLTNATTNHESNPSPVVTKTTTGGNQTVTVDVPATTDAQNTHWNVYRKSPGFAVPYLVNASPIAIGTPTYADSGGAGQTDANLLDRNIQLERDHDAAPAAAVVADQTYNGRILVANSATYPNRIWYTPSLKPWYFPGAPNAADGNWVDVGTDRNDAILAMTVKPSMVIVWRQRSIWRIRGDLNDGVVELVAPDVGIVGVRAVAPSSLGDYCVGKEGLYVTNGDFARKVSQKIDPLFRGEPTDVASGINLSYLDDNQRAKCALGYRHGRLYFSFVGQGYSVPTDGYILHTETGRFTRRQNSYGGGWGAFYDEGENGYLLGAGNGKLYTLEDTYTEDLGGMSLAYHSAYEDQGLPDREKSYGDLVIRHNTRGANLTVKVYTNKGVASTDEIAVGSLISTTETKSTIPLVYPASWPVAAKIGQPIDPAYNLAIRIEGTSDNDQSLPVEIYGPILLHYYVAARKARRFDSFETDHGTRQIKTIDAVELDVDATDDDLTLQIWSDIPGGTMAIRLGAGTTISRTVVRKIMPVTLATPISGRLFRYVLTQNGVDLTQGFRLYGLRARMVTTGVYLDSSVAGGDRWQTQEISLGV